MPQQNKWLRTGFQVGGVSSVDSGAHTLMGASVIRPGEALGHGVWIDAAFCQSVCAMASQGKLASAGIKARFGHPNMCSDALGTFLGRWKNIKVDEMGKVSGDLHLSSTASESPKGDLRKYVEEMAANEPDHFGASIVFTADQKAMEDYAVQYGAVKQGMEIDLSSFKSPDPANVKNLPHARCSELHAIDLVDDPAATDGMFSGAAGLSLAGQVTEWLDTHPEVFSALSQDNGMLDILSRYSGELKPFIERYAKNMTENTELEVVVTETPVVAEPTPEVVPPVEVVAEPIAEPLASDVVATALTAQQSEELKSLAVKIDGMSAENITFKKERDEALASLESVRAELAAAIAGLDIANAKLAAIQFGQEPASSVAKVDKLSAIEVARKTARI